MMPACAAETHAAAGGRKPRRCASRRSPSPQNFPLHRLTPQPGTFGGKSSRNAVFGPSPFGSFGRFVGSRARQGGVVCVAQRRGERREDGKKRDPPSLLPPLRAQRLCANPFPRPFPSHDPFGSALRMLPAQVPSTGFPQWAVHQSKHKQKRPKLWVTPLLRLTPQPGTSGGKSSRNAVFGPSPFG